MWQPTPVFLPGNFMDSGARWATDHGSQRVGQAEHTRTHGMELICNKKNCISEHNRFDMNGFAHCQCCLQARTSSWRPLLHMEMSLL